MKGMMNQIWPLLCNGWGHIDLFIYSLVSNTKGVRIVQKLEKSQNLISDGGTAINGEVKMLPTMLYKTYCFLGTNLYQGWRNKSIVMTYL